MKRIFILILIAAAAFCATSYQNIFAESTTQDKLSFQTTVFDFGQVLISDGPISCKFVATNKTSESIVIRSVTTSCHCTNVKWDKNEIKPGAKTEIAVTYSNDEGPYPFEKSITVYVLGQPKPIILHVRGISQEKKLSDVEMFTQVFCSSFGMQQTELKCGNLEQGGSKGDQCTVANLSNKPINVSFNNISDGLSIKVSPNPIPAKGHATLQYTVESRKNKWGWNDYFATVAVDGKSEALKKISVRAFTSDTFSNLTQQDKAKGSRPIFEESTFSFGHVKQGESINATFVCQNKGQSALHIHKIDIDCPTNSYSSLPDIPAGAKGKFSVSLNTKNLPKGEALVIVTLTTNSPIRPIVSLFVAGWID